MVTFGAAHLYVSQSDKGELVMGGDIDGYNSFAQRGNLPVIEHVAACLLALLPQFSRLRNLRSWGGDANVIRPLAPEDTDDGAWIDYLYLRDNAKGGHDELWQHIFGCRRWLHVRRDVVSHEIIGCSELTEGKP